MNTDLPITGENFIRMWKTLILKRVQDVYEKEKHVRSDHYVRLDRSILTPAPLTDLLYALGYTEWLNITYTMDYSQDDISNLEKRLNT